MKSKYFTYILFNFSLLCLYYLKYPSLLKLGEIFKKLGKLWGGSSPIPIPRIDTVQYTLTVVAVQFQEL